MGRLSNTSALGSSPRMRGAPGFGRPSRPVEGIIPADAGSTIHIHYDMQERGDHPRGCGEHDRLEHDLLLLQGSSPRMRGALNKAPNLWLFTGIIPADAGSTHQFVPVGPNQRDHPRGCGEHSIGEPEAIIQEGSSPRMRGARGSPPGAFCIKGIIPADAGSTTISQLLIRAIEDHPRGCGEHSIMTHPPYRLLGSSPRMRGAPCAERGIGQIPGIIPADAGSTHSSKREP